MKTLAIAVALIVMTGCYVKANDTKVTPVKRDFVVTVSCTAGNKIEVTRTIFNTESGKRMFVHSDVTVEPKVCKEDFSMTVDTALGEYVSKTRDFNKFD